MSENTNVSNKISDLYSSIEQNNRVFAILDAGDVASDVYLSKIVSKVKNYDLNNRPIVFNYMQDKTDDPNALFVKLEKKNSATMYNDTIAWLRKNYSGKSVKAHLLQNNIEFLKDPKDFIAEIEKMMDMLDYDVWFNTITDECNYIFTKYDCRFAVAINNCDLQKVYDKTVLWTSHSNPNYMIVDIDKFKSFEEDSDALFDEKFNIPMFYIIKYLAKRKMAKRGFMNYYPTIPEEHGTFKTFDTNKRDDFSPENMKKEDELFRSMNLDHVPNGNPEEVMDYMIKKLSRFK